MKPNLVLEIGSKYSKTELTELINEPTLSTVRECVFSCKNSDAYLLFVDLENFEILVGEINCHDHPKDR